MRLSPKHTITGWIICYFWCDFYSTPSVLHQKKKTKKQQKITKPTIWRHLQLYWYNIWKCKCFTVILSRSVHLNTNYLCKFVNGMCWVHTTQKSIVNIGNYYIFTISLTFRENRKRLEDKAITFWKWSLWPLYVVCVSPLFRISKNNSHISRIAAHTKKHFFFSFSLFLCPWSLVIIYKCHVQFNYDSFPIY